MRSIQAVAVALIAVTSLASYGEAQTEEHTLTSGKVGACCAGADDFRHISRDECLALGAEATWFILTETVEVACGACAHGEDITCRYTTENRCADPDELFCSDKTCAKCLEQAIPDDDPPSGCMMHRLFRDNSMVIGNMATFHEFQERIVVESAKGREMKALFHDHMFELGLVLMRNPDLAQRGSELLQVAASGFRDLLGEADGEELVLTPTRVRTINEFLADVAAHASPAAQSALDQVQAEFDAVEGKSLREIRTLYESQ